MGKAELEEESRNPPHNNQIDGDTAAELIRIKNTHKARGPKKYTRDLCQSLSEERSAISF